ncbi:MAG: hypothetical protein LWY06_17215 [Firmicutes bacterium]|nr:hypothetical protein [Bacillota bacterium]
MGIREKFTDDEWELVTGAPFLAGLAASLSDTTPSCFEKEMDAHIKNLKKSRDKYAHNPLISAILDEYYREDNAVSPEQPAASDENQEEPGEDITEDIMRTMGQRIEELSKAAKLAEEKLPQGEAQEFKQFLYDLAYVVANAAGEGFLGNWGKRISRQEAGFLEKLRLALNL